MKRRVKRVTKGLAPLTARSTPQAVHPNLIKWLAVFCVLDCVGAVTLPSSPPPKFEAGAVPPPCVHGVMPDSYMVTLRSPGGLHTTEDRQLSVA